MKKYIVIFLINIFLVGYISAQERYTPTVVGSSTGFISGHDYNIPFVIGQTIVSDLTQIDSTKIRLGFPYDVSYLKNTFTGEFFCSKGYFADYVSLRWSIASNSERISEFIISRRMLGSNNADDFEVIATVDRNARSWRDIYSDAATLYEYKVKANGIVPAYDSLYFNYVKGIGFRMPFGIITGRITYEGGTAVEGVSVLAETNQSVPYYALSFNGNNSAIRIDETQNSSVTSTNGFTFQAWIKNTSTDTTLRRTIFDKTNTTSLQLRNNTISFNFNTVGSISISCAEMSDNYFHVTTVRNNNTLSIYLSDGINFKSISETFNINSSTDVARTFHIGEKHDNSEYFVGFMDEIRIWTRALDSTEIVRDFDRLISGEEQGLIAYYQLNEGVGNMAYDLTQSGGTYNMNNAQILYADWIRTTPQFLKLKGITDADGNYIITRIPYSEGGSNYRIIPSMGVHTFTPSQGIRYIASGASIHNNVDFIDNSSFSVEGVVYYQNTTIPVKDVNIFVDGNMAIRNRNAVKTNDLGEFVIDVPIGNHRITLGKRGHVFTDGFPDRTYENRFGELDSLFDFQNDIVSPIQFWDSTLALFTGRMAGGIVEEAKPLGFGLSKSNLGYGKIVLELQTNVGMLRETKDSITYTCNDSINNNYTIFQNDITIYPDTATGEFAVLLPPANYNVSSASAGRLDNVDDYIFNASVLGTFNLDINTKDSSMYKYTSDTVIVFNDSIIFRDDTSGTVNANIDTTYICDSSYYYFNKRWDFIYRNEPTIDISQSGQSFFGSPLVILTDADGNPTDTINLYTDSTGYLFNYPIFHQTVNYKFDINVYEEYENKVTGNVIRIPQNDGGEISINNNLARDNSTYTDTLNSEGYISYIFEGGEANLIAPHTLASAFQYKYNINGVDKTVQAEPIIGIVLGGKSTGSNFVTSGPTNIDMILRDPPGSKSYAFLEAGNTITNSKKHVGSVAVNIEGSATVHAGAKIETASGFGVMVMSDVSSTLDITTNIRTSIKNTFTGDIINTSTNTERWQTSESSDYIGSMGDIFIGHSTNIIFGQTRNVGILKDSTGTPVLALANSFRLSPEFGTHFMYSQNHIENYLIPNLIAIRNNFFSQQPDIYVPVNPSNPEYENTSYIDDTTGNAYSFFPSIQMQRSGTTQAADSIKIYNNWIKGWKDKLALNEKAKVESIANAEQTGTNRSFDAGVNYQNSILNTNSYEFSHTVSSELFNSGELATGVRIVGIGVTLKLKQELGITYDFTHGEKEEQSITFGYVLAEENQGNYFSVDVIPAVDGFGPVFRTRGGQSMCPHHAEELTQYYEPGSHILNVETEQLEIPKIMINNLKVANQINVPANNSAFFDLNLINESQAGNNVMFNVSLVDSTNPDGAILRIDGQVLGTFPVMVPSLRSVNKTLSVSMGRPNVFRYENIGIVLKSQCNGDPTTDGTLIADTAYISVEFVPACTRVSLESPLNHWVMNVNNPTTLVKAVDFNQNEENFSSIALQYKPSASSNWVNMKTFFKYQSDLDDYDGEGVLLSGSSAMLNINNTFGVDQQYDIRAVAQCNDNIMSYSDIASGIKDMKPPHVFGTPQPSTGILNMGQDISIQFDESVEAGLISNAYIQASGILNGSAINHGTSLNFDGISGWAKAEGFSFTNQPFTIEFWMQRSDTANAGVIFGRGLDVAEKIEIATNNNTDISITLGESNFDIDISPCFTTATPATAWHHYALVYDTSGVVNFYGDDRLLFSQSGINFNPRKREAIYFGRNVEATSYGSANIDDIRIWNSARSHGNIIANMSVLLSGSELGLASYWPLSEGKGNLTVDKAGANTLSLNCPWQIALENKAMSFNASEQQFLLVNIRQMSLTNEQDATIEFWIKAPQQEERACILYNGVSDSAASGYNINAYGIFLEQSGELSLTVGGITNIITNTTISDDSWYHFAMVIDRLSNVRTYLNGNLQKQLPISLFEDMVGMDMSIGACRKQLTADSIVTTNFFTGSIDELRIWTTARSNAFVRKYQNTKLQADEVGLLYYFPFEEYRNMSGMQVIARSLKNNVDSVAQIEAMMARTDTVVARIINNAEYVLQAPPVMDAQPKTNLNASFEVNNDRLIINLPSQYAYLYEKCNIELSVKNIFDRNGNMLPSPVQWLAYINQNPVVWAENQKTITKDIGENKEFTAEILNNSGVPKYFNIGNIPAWLSVSPQFGTIAPNSSLTLTFTINPGLNIGAYSQALNLTTDFGYDEKLHLNVKVNAQSPDWNVNPSEYQYSMNIFGKVSINNIISTNEDVIVSAFINGECRGVARLQYLSDFDVTQAMLTIYSNYTNDDVIELKVWDASTGMIYSEVTPEYNFVADVVHGSPSNPELIICSNVIQASYVANRGWNWISVNLQNQTSNSINNILRGVGTNCDEIKSQYKGFNRYSTTAGWSGALDTTAGMIPDIMFKLKLTQGGTITYSGTPFNTETNTVEIRNGWNWIGFVPQFNISVNEALASYGPSDGDIIKSQREFSMFYNGIGWVGTLQFLEPGKGYMLHSITNSTLTYPEIGLLKACYLKQDIVLPSTIDYNPGLYASNTTIIAQIANPNINTNGKVIAVFDKGECVGIATKSVHIDDKTLFFINTGVNQHISGASFGLVDIHNNSVAIFDNKLNYSENEQIGTLKNPYMLNISENNNFSIVEREDYFEVFPNPFKNNLNLRGYIWQDETLELQITNNLTQVLFQTVISVKAGDIDIDLEKLINTQTNTMVRGSYLLTIQTKSSLYNFTLIKH
jgi:hypothetical protein